MPPIWFSWRLFWSDQTTLIEVSAVLIMSGKAKPTSDVAVRRDKLRGDYSRESYTSKMRKAMYSLFIALSQTLTREAMAKKKRPESLKVEVKTWILGWDLFRLFWIFCRTSNGNLDLESNWGCTLLRVPSCTPSNDQVHPKFWSCALTWTARTKLEIEFNAQGIDQASDLFVIQGVKVTPGLITSFLSSRQQPLLQPEVCGKIYGVRMMFFQAEYPHLVEKMAIHFGYNVGDRNLCTVSVRSFTCSRKD